LPGRSRRRGFRIPDMCAGIFTLGIGGFIIALAFLKIEQRLLRRRRQRRGAKGEM
jgi:ABC-type nitrate/sulfonate/bicarbonate transport system permease component